MRDIPNKNIPLYLNNKKLKIPKNNQSKKRGNTGRTAKKKLLKSENWIMI